MGETGKELASSATGMNRRLAMMDSVLCSMVEEKRKKKKKEEKEEGLRRRGGFCVARFSKLVPLTIGNMTIESELGGVN